MDKHSTDIQFDKSFLTNNAAYWIEIDRRNNIKKSVTKTLRILLDMEMKQ